MNRGDVMIILGILLMLIAAVMDAIRGPEIHAYPETAVIGRSNASHLGGLEQ